MKKILTNPFFVYIISFSIVLIVYTLGWSDLYPELRLPTILFLGATFLASLFFGTVLQKMRRVHFERLTNTPSFLASTALIYFGYIIEFIYNNGVPLLLILRGEEYDYRTFGVPTFHVILSTFNSFYAAYIFHHLRSHPGKKNLAYFVLNLIPSLLIMNRGMFLMILTACLFIFILSTERIRFSAILSIGVSVLMLLYVFGVLGNIRVSKGATTSSEHILTIGEATESFKESAIPKKYFWGYLYISSPLGNLQHTLDQSDVEDKKWAHFFLLELVPDFISKRVGPKFHVTEQTPPLIASWLNVSTLYSASFNYIGWSGLILMFTFMTVYIFTYLLLLRKRSPFYVTGLAILNTIIVYNTFDNMFTFTGLSFQLIYPLLFCYFKLPSFKVRYLPGKVA